MLIVGLTGSIGMGKTTTAAMFASHGVPVFDADAEVGRLYQVGGAGVAPVEAAFPGVSVAGAIDRDRLGRSVLGDPAALARLNAIVWPLVGAARQDFLSASRAAGDSMVLLDIPLLYETGGERTVDAVVVVTAPAEIQRERVLSRLGMTPDKLAAILSAQTPDAEKRSRADFVVDTGRGLEHAAALVRDIVAALRRRAETAH